MTRPDGLFLTLEGGEGAGKSTLARRLDEALRGLGLDVVLTREPGGSPGASAIRTLLVQGEADRWSALSETLLLAAARNDHLERTIRPALTRGAVVICDRFRDSTRAYQVAGRGLPVQTEAALNAMIAAPDPDLTLLLDLDPAKGVARSRGVAVGEARYESMDLTVHQAIRAAFLAIAQSEPARVVVIDASRDQDTVFADALAAVRARLHDKGHG